MIGGRGQWVIGSRQPGKSKLLEAIGPRPPPSGPKFVLLGIDEMAAWDEWRIRSDRERLVQEQE